VEALLLILCVLGVILWLATRAKVKDLEQRLANVDTFSLSEQIRALTARLWSLEQEVAALRQASKVRAPAAPTIDESAEPPATVRGPVQAIPPSVPAESRPAQPAAPPTKPERDWPPVSGPETLQPSGPLYQLTDRPVEPGLGERMRGWLGNEEWEALVGASLLNKLGALVTVIGLTLLLSFSFTNMGPAGRAATALCASVALLAGGVWMERRVRYRLYARGLIGAGWAGLYATTYAIYTVPAARIIDNPVVGSALLVLVALGMIAHSLHYKAATVTAVAYFTAFAAFAVTPSSAFAVVSLIPLAASLLYLAHRFEWHGMALFGMAATYLTCIYRGEAGAPLLASETLFVVYWLLFELFDLLRVRRRLTGAGLEWIFPLNAIAFLALSYLAWANKEPHGLWRMAAFAAGLFLASAIARAVLRPRSSFAETDGLSERLQAGSYEASLTLAAVLAGLAIVGRVPGVWIGAGLAIEAELIYLAGVKLRSRFLRGLGMAGFVFSLGRVLIVDLTAMEQSRVLGHTVWNWSPVAILHVALFYVNRVMGGTRVFSFVATALLAAVGAAELPRRALGTAWLLYGFVLFEVGLRRRLMEFRVQAYVLAVLGAGATIALHAAGEAPRPWLALACSLLAVYGQALRIRRLGRDLLEGDEREGVEWVLAGASAVLAALLLWRTVGLEYLGLAWCLLAVALLELGLRQWPARLRLFAYPAALLGAIGVFWTHADHFQKLPPTATWVSYFGAAVCALAMVARLTWRPPAAASSAERGLLRDALGLAGTLWLAAAIWLVAPDAWVSLLWAVVGVAWLETGFALRLGSFRGLAHATLAGMALRILAVDVGAATSRWWIMSAAAAVFYFVSWRLHCQRAPENGGAVVHRMMATLLAAVLMHLEFGSWDATAWALYGLALLGVGVYWGVRDLRWAGYALGFAAALRTAVTILDGSARWWGAVIVASALYAGQFLAPRGSGGDGLEAKARPAMSVLATGLVTWLLYQRMPTSYLTLACGAQGVALLLAGFPLRERVLRLQGLALLLLCILKLFIYDLRNLETLYRILSFITLGLILLGVSWVYTRFRDRLKAYL
jgi:uncharacterized membrane protein